MSDVTKAILIALFASAPAAALAAPCAGFTDVDDSSPFCANVVWLKNRAVTAGCTATTYCPAESVNRLAMAAFMNRLGDKLSPVKLFSDQNPGPITIQNGSYGFVCPSAPYTPPFEQTATVHANAWGLVSGAVGWAADIWYSIDGGATFAFITNFIPQFSAPTAGMTSGAAFATINLVPGKTYIFATLIRKAPDAPNGPGNFTDLACHQMVEIMNRSTAAPPPPPPPPCDPGTSVGCGDPTQALQRRNAGSLATN